jgi:hypothetical protein|tara:strand:- start:71 stop:454 length:384 start_codon:yes stop_codon:yes gene_type:complete
MVYNTVFLSLRMKLDEVVKDLDYEKKVIENIKYCRRIIGKEFKVIFWNKELLESEVKDFIKRNSETLIEVNTEITKEFNICWFVIGEEDESKHRYMYNGEILSGIAAFLKVSKILIKKDRNEDSYNR